jgi:CheY-like chemotaxis protein
VLVVDEVSTNRDAIAALLQPVGFLVDEAVDGLDATRSVEAQAPDLILLDDHMPPQSDARSSHRRPRGPRSRLAHASHSRFPEAWVS